jgi:hypothetical protein
MRILLSILSILAQIFISASADCTKSTNCANDPECQNQKCQNIIVAEVKLRDYCNLTNFNFEAVELDCDKIQVFNVDESSSVINSDDFEVSLFDRDEQVQGIYLNGGVTFNHLTLDLEKTGKIEFLPVRIWDKFPNIFVIFAQEQLIKKVTRASLEKLSMLLHLNLAQNEIIDIEDGAFDDLTELKILELNRNKLTKLRENVFAKLFNLEKLAIYHNQLTYLDPELLANLQKLTVLDVSMNKITTLNAYVFDGLISLERLFLTENDLLSLPEKIFSRLVSLKHIDAAANKLTSLPEDIFITNQKLSHVDFDFNKITKLSFKTFENAANLMFLSLKLNRCINKSFGISTSEDLLSEDLMNQLMSDLDEKCSDRVEFSLNKKS